MTPDTPEVRRGAVRWLARETMGTAMVGVILFWSAGTMRWPMGWVLVALYAAWVGANTLLLWPENKALLAERAQKRPPGAKKWDLALMGAVGILTIARFVVAGLDLRYGWGPEVPIALAIAAVPVAALGYALVTWGMVANAWFATHVRIQSDRGQQVATGGPYRWVRHPGYLGSVLFEISSGLLLGSWWALAIGAASAALFLLRTAMEDRTLREELPGYREYAEKTRFRLLPGVW
jgi:protein-S-isoprenylcysteine O-methyltransferase Ste14